MSIATMFAPDHVRHEGVRPIHIYLLRLFYFLIAAFVGFEAWSTLLTHEGPWNHTVALTWCFFAGYSTLSILGLFRPLRMLPIMLLVLLYKSLWLIVVAVPLWRAGTMAGNPAEEMAGVFMWIPVLVLVLPWGYVWRTYLRPSRAPRAPSPIS
jgi:hypothetical protein